MTVEILMPALSPTMTQGNLANWLKKEGDKVEPGEVIAEIETDKATMEVEAVDSGIIAKILIPANSQNVKVNEVIAILREEEDSDSDIAEAISKYDGSFKQSNVAEPNDLIAMKENDNETENYISNDEKNIRSSGIHLNDKRNDKIEGRNRIFISPLARKIARENNLDITTIVGRGPNGRIVKNDIIKSLENLSKQQDSLDSSLSLASSQEKEKISRQNLNFSDINLDPKNSNQQKTKEKILPISNMRKIIAQRLTEAKVEIPHFYLSFESKIDQLLELRQDLNQKAEGKYKVSINDIFVKASAMAAKEVPEVNLSWSDRGIIQHQSIDIAVAVALDDGLITPIVTNVDQKSILTISSEIKDLVTRAKEKKLQAREFQGGSFSISNLGMYGIEKFTAIINPPQSFILAVGASIAKPLVENNNIVIGHTLTINMSCDHRVIDGAIAAQFCSALNHYLTNPLMILL